MTQDLSTLAYQIKLAVITNYSINPQGMKIWVKNQK